MSDSDSIVFILTRPQYEANIGAVARVTKNFDFQSLWLIAPECSLGLEARRRAMMGADLLDKVRFFPDLQSALAEVDVAAAVTRRYDSGKPGWSTVASFAETRLRTYSNARVALVFGPEDAGLSREEVSLCHQSIEIPASEHDGVLNLSHAVAVVAYELYQAQYRLDAPEHRQDLVSHDQRSVLLERSRTVLQLLGKGLDEEKVIRRLGRTAARSQLDQADYRLWMSLLSRVLRLAQAEPSPEDGP